MDEDGMMTKKSQAEIDAEFLAKKKKPEVKNKLLDKTPDKKLSQDKKVEKKEEAKKPEEKEETKPDPVEEKTIPTIEELEKKLLDPEEPEDTENPDKPKKKFDEYKSIRSFGDAIDDSKIDKSGVSLLKWICQNQKKMQNFSDNAKSLIYRELYDNHFVDKSKPASFPFVPSDMPAEDQSKACINAFALNYLFSDKKEFNNADYHASLLALDSVKKEKEKKEIVTVHPALNKFIENKNKEKPDEISTGMRI